MEPEKIERQEKSLVEEMRDMREQMALLSDRKTQKEKKKSFKFPSGVSRQTKNLKKLIEKDRYQVILLKKSGGIVPTLGELKDGKMMVGGYLYNGNSDFVWRWNGKVPTAIVCEWDIEPVTKQRLTEQTEALKSYIAPQTIILDAIMALRSRDAFKEKRKISIGFIIALGVVALVVGYLFFGGGA